jgi:hypothetical protein
MYVRWTLVSHLPQVAERGKSIDPNMGDGYQGRQGDANRRGKALCIG